MFLVAAFSNTASSLHRAGASLPKHILLFSVECLILVGVTVVGYVLWFILSISTFDHFIALTWSICGWKEKHRILFENAINPWLIATEE